MRAVEARRINNSLLRVRSIICRCHILGRCQKDSWKCISVREVREGWQSRRCEGHHLPAGDLQSRPSARVARGGCTASVFKWKARQIGGTGTARLLPLSRQTLLTHCRLFHCTDVHSVSHSQHHTDETPANRAALAAGLKPDWLSGFCSRITKIF